MKRRLAIAFTVACLLVTTAIPSPAFAVAERITCRVDVTAVHSPLLSFGIARSSGNIHVAPVVTCVDFAQQSYTTTGRTWVEVQNPTDGTWRSFPAPGFDRYCSIPSMFGASTSVCSTSASYSDPALTQAKFRGCFDLSTPIDLPARCVAAVTTP